MNEYNVTITERLVKTLRIEAESIEKAIEKAEAMVNSCEVVLEADDFIDRDFDCELIRFPALSKSPYYSSIWIDELPVSTVAKLNDELAYYLDNKDTSLGAEILDKSPVARWYAGLMSATEVIKFYKNEG